MLELLTLLLTFCPFLFHTISSDNIYNFIDVSNITTQKDFFRGAYPEGVSSPIFIQEGLKKRDVVNCFDPSDISSIPPRCTHTWVDKELRPLYSRNFHVLPSGDLQITNASTHHSFFYRCILQSKVAHVRLVFNRPIIVFLTPSFSLKRLIIFQCKRRDTLLAKQVFAHVVKFFCEHRVTGCDYNFNSVGFKELYDGYEYRIEMFQQSPSNFHPPRCNYQCVKNAYVTLLLSNQQKQLKNFEWRSAGAINSFSKFVYIPSGSSSEVVATCGRGFMLFKEKVCLPCLEGWYGDGKGLCKKCGYFWYQPRFASSSCLLCPYLSFSLLATKTHPQQCVAFSSNTAAQNYVIIFFVIISFVFWVCSLQCGLLPCLYQPITSQPRNKEIDKSYMKVLNKHRKKSQQIKRLLQRAEKMEAKCFEMTESPYKKAGFLSKLLYCWLNNFVKKGDKVEDADVYNISRDESSHYLCKKLERVWNEKKGLRHALTRSLMRVHGRHLFLWSFVFFLQEIFKIIQPVLIGKLIEHYTEKHQDSTQAYMYAGAVCVSITIPIFILHHYFYAMFKIAMNVRVACCDLLYQKSLKLNIEQTSPTAVAQLINLMSNDMSRLDIAFSILPFLVIGPLELIVVTCILYFYIGWVSLVVSLFVFLSVPFSISLAKLFAYLRRETTKLTDQRLSIMTQVLNNMKYIRMSCWERVVIDKVEGVRSKELQKMLQSGCARGLNLTSSFLSGKLIILVLIVCVVFGGGMPDAKTVFVAMSIYNPLRFSLTFCFPMALQFGAESFVTIAKIQEFLMSEEKEAKKSKKEEEKKADPEKNEMELHGSMEGGRRGKAYIKVENLSLYWKQRDKPFLRNLTFDLEGNDLVMVVGAVGVGKTSLLLSLLGETPQNGDPPLTMGTVAYVSQEAWLFNATIRQNILMGEGMVEDRYQKVLSCACLLPDLQGMREGDETIVADKGSNLSGGQRARVSLARALYRNCDIYLLDDPLSAVDAHVAYTLFHRCIKGYLKDKLRLLVTHHTQFLSHATKVLCLREDQEHTYKCYDDMMKKGCDVERVVMAASEGGGGDGGEEGPPKTPSTVDVSDVSLISLNNQSEASDEQKQKKQAVTAATYFRYVTAGSGLLAFLLLLLLHAATQAVFLFSDWWLVYWCKAVEDSKSLSANLTFLKITHNITTNTTIQHTPTANHFDSTSYFRPFCLICLLLLSLAIVRALSTFKLLTKCNKVLHSRMLLAVIKAPMTFFSTNQTGIILDHFSRDQGLTDEMLPFFLFDLIQQSFMVVGVFVMLCVLNYWVIIIITIIIVFFLLLRSYFLKSFKAVKIIEAKNKGPVFSHINTTFLGLTTIRSHGAEGQFKGEFEKLQDVHTSAFSLLLSLGRWFALRLELLCVVIICFVTFASVAAADQMDGGRLGLSLTYSITLLWLFQWVVRQSADVDNLMTHVSRILDYTQLPPEQQITFRQSRLNKKVDIEKQALKDDKPKRTEEEKLLKDGLGLADGWPTGGKIEFRNVRLKYKSSGPLVFKNLSFCVAPGQKVGIVGRTGAGKSSLLNVIFKMASFEGSVLIDDVNIDLLPVSVLRSRVSIIPQDQLILDGTVRDNMDPEGLYEERQLKRVVEKVKLDRLVANLDHHLDGGGVNLSCGEQQLLGLSRVLLKNNKILLVDEATARVDHVTDSFIQSTLRENFRDMTVLIIAHRINTVIDCDLIMVLDRGMISEFDTPFNLLNNYQGPFYQLAAQAGERELGRFKKIAASKQP